MPVDHRAQATCLQRADHVLLATSADDQGLKPQLAATSKVEPQSAVEATGCQERSQRSLKGDEPGATVETIESCSAKKLSLMSTEDGSF